MAIARPTNATGLVVLSEEPLNAESPIAELRGGIATPNPGFYVRNHYPQPGLDRRSYRLRIGGLVRRSLRLSMRDLVNLPVHAEEVTLECAGNGRSTLEPPVEGEQWGLGAVSSAEWAGVPLKALLSKAGIEAHAKEVVFRGADGDDQARFERSLGLEDALGSGAFLAYAMNGELLPEEHGAPVRLVVPGWYGVASVKWLTEIEVIDHAFLGHFQSERYVYEWDRDGDLVREPVRDQRVRALITHPSQGESVSSGRLAIGGLAWSGVSPVAKVEVSVDHGLWLPVEQIGDQVGLAWRWWESVAVIGPGTVSLRARATDESGRVQPERAEWNRLGYGNNSIQEVIVTAV